MKTDLTQMRKAVVESPNPKSQNPKKLQIPNAKKIMVSHWPTPPKSSPRSGARGATRPTTAEGHLGDQAARKS
jgi:hypothetical protein